MVDLLSRPQWAYWRNCRSSSSVDNVCITDSVMLSASDKVVSTAWSIAGEQDKEEIAKEDKRIQVTLDGWRESFLIAKKSISVRKQFREADCIISITEPGATDERDFQLHTVYFVAHKVCRIDRLLHWQNFSPFEKIDCWPNELLADPYRQIFAFMKSSYWSPPNGLAFESLKSTPI